MSRQNKRKITDDDDEALPACAVSRPETIGGAGPFAEHISAMGVLMAKLEHDVAQEAYDTRKEQLIAEKQMEIAKVKCNVSSIVKLNVGGVNFDVPRSTLLKDDGSFFHTFLDEEHQFPIENDARGRILVDRDPRTFHHVINYLRGYRHFNHLSSEELSMLLDDAEYYQLPRLKGMIQPLPPPTMAFGPGPGVNMDRNRFRVQYGIGIVGEKPMISGRHRIIYEVLDDHYLGLGVVSESCVSSDQEFHKVANCCVYYMTGVFYSSFPHFKKEENLERFENGSIVTLTLDMDDRTLEFHVLGRPPKTVTCGTASSLRFAVAMKLQAAVRILDEIPADRK